MDQIRKFLRGKGFALAMAACLLAAAAAGVWAVRTIRNELEKSLDGLQLPGSTAEQQTLPGIDEGLNTREDEAEWQQQTTQAANSAANVPQADSASSAPQAASSGARSGSGSVSEPSELRTGSEPASSSAEPASTQPVAGRILNAYSGDELVYNKTLGDWRTHNGVDYACQQGEQVCAPTAGKVTAVETDGRWGGIVAVEDSAGRVWRLCGVADPEVHQGDSVTPGQLVGKAGNISCECAEESHIHLEVMEGSSYLDPARLVG